MEKEQERINNIITNVLADARDKIIRLIENPATQGEAIHPSFAAGHFPNTCPQCNNGTGNHTLSTQV